MEIYVLKDGNQIGPFTKDQLRSGLGSGEFSETTLGWHEGMSDWKPVGGICKEENSKATNRDEMLPPVPSKSDSLDSDPSSVFSMEDGSELGIQKTISVFKSLDYGFLLPVTKIFSPDLLRKKAVRWVLFFGLTPLGIWVFAMKYGLSFKETIWLYETYFCIFWALYFQSLIHPTAGIWKRALGYGMFTVIVGIPFDLFCQSLPVIRNLMAASEGASLFTKIPGNILGVGILEETVKALPLLIFSLRKQDSLKPRDALFLGFVSGLGFAATEGVLYSFGAAQDAFQATADYADAAFTVQILQTMFRLMSGTLLHAVWAGTTGWFIGIAAAKKQYRWAIIAIGISFMAFLHGLNDVFAGGFGHIIIAAVSILIFMSYLAFGEEQTQTTSAEPSK